MFARVIALAAVLAGCATAQKPVALASEEIEPLLPMNFAEQCDPWDDWDTPAPPYRIHGDTYYVGTCGISAILVAGEDGHTLIDTGTDRGAQFVLANIERLGFAIKDVALILSSHEHFDHVGGLARMVEATGARVLASPIAAEVIRTGREDAADPQAGMHEAMVPVPLVEAFSFGDTVRAGPASIEVTPISTPGHTPGATSWQWQSCDEAGRCLSLVYADSLSPVSADDYRFSDHSDYIAAYRAGLDRLRETKCDVLLTPHPSASRMVERALEGTLVSGPTCVEYADSVEARLDKRLAEEASR